MAKNAENEFYFLKYDYLSLREEMRENLKYQKELGWACIAAVLTFLGVVLSMEHVIPELCLLPLPILLFCSAKVKELKKSNIRIIKYINMKSKDLKEWTKREESGQPKRNSRNTESEIQLWEQYLYQTRMGNTDKKCICKRICDWLVYVLSTSEYIIMGVMCLFIYAMKTMKNCDCIQKIKDLRGCGIFVSGCILLGGIVLVSWGYWRITKRDLSS